MSCEEIRDRIPDILTGEMDPADRAAFDAHIAQCPGCAEELRRLTETWTRLGVLPMERPSQDLSDRFYKMLEAEQEKLEKARAFAAPERRRPSFARRVSDAFARLRPMPAFQFGAALLILAIGIGGGLMLGPKDTTKVQVAALGREVQDMRQAMASTLLQQPSSSDRIRGVSFTEKIAAPGRNTIDMLLRTLDSDPSVNVRLAAVDALYLFAGQPGVKEGIVRSLSTQPSPLVQVALIDLLVGIRERKAVDAFKALVGDQKLDPGVRHKAELGIQQLSF